jgi:hypothetical protein
MEVWLSRRLQCPLRQEAALPRVNIATDAGTPTNDRRDNVLLTRERAHALNRGGAID